MPSIQALRASAIDEPAGSAGPGTVPVQRAKARQRQDSSGPSAAHELRSSWGEVCSDCDPSGVAQGGLDSLRSQLVQGRASGLGFKPGLNPTSALGASIIYPVKWGWCCLPPSWVTRVACLQCRWPSMVNGQL